MKNTNWLGTCGLAHGVVISTMNDLQFVVGSGDNFFALVIDFNDGEIQESFAWGYRYDGMASGEDLLIAIAGADPNLTFDSTSFITEVTYFDGAVSHTATSDFGAGAVSWGYYVAGGTAADTPIAGGGMDYPSSFTTSPSGAAAVNFGMPGRILEDGSWDAWSFGSYDPDTFAHQVAPGPEAPEAAVIPEPSAVVFGLSFLILSALRRKR